MQEIRAYALALGVQPTTIVQRAAKVSGSSWSKWESGDVSPKHSTTDKILKYIADNPVPEVDAEPLKAVG